MVGAQGSPYLEPDQWQFNLGWRYQFSDRHFTGTDEDEDRQSGETQVKNTIHLLDLGVTYGYSKQTTFSISVPYLMAKRDIPGIYRDEEGDILRAPNGANETRSAGLGDVSVVARRWLLDVDENPDQNIAIGFGLKLPTGDPGVEGAVQVRNNNGTPFDPNDDTFTNEVRTNDQSIQPGDGGLGFVLDVQAFKRVGIFTPYVFGTYLFNPMEKNGVRTYRSKPGEEEMSIPDQYLARIGTMMAVNSVEGLALGLGGRIEGIPVRDILGGDEGFRRPGFAISVEPQVVYARGANVYSLAVPVAVVRNRHRSVADQEAGGHGDAAFADWLLAFNWSHRF